MNPLNMSTPQETVQCASRFIETKSDDQTQRNCRTKYGRDMTSHPLIRVMETRRVLHKG